VIPIIAVFVGAAVAFGLIHDQITARVCVEYFTIAHGRLVSSDSPTVLGLVWGVVATWWAGAIAGIVVGWAAREGPWPKLGWRAVIRPASYLALAMAVAALVAGLAGYTLTAHHVVDIVPSYADAIAPERQARFMADVFAHRASYAIGLAGAVAVATWCVVSRRRLAR
jgi:hypothetical protein